ncbi:hypothetical protein B0H14DRAFT_82631 [Mycena olivaceomarginata]|nr:hypothetical protein B0H14DRAFT_82631 [Mycena olivaceomarginata]
MSSCCRRLFPWRRRKHTKIISESTQLVPGPSINQAGPSVNRWHGIGNVALEGLVTALGVTKEVGAIFPPLQGAVGGLLAVVDVFQQAASNKDDVKTLAEYVTRLNAMMKPYTARDYASFPEALRERLVEMSGQIESISTVIRQLESQSYASQLLKTKAIEGQISENIRVISWSIHVFLVGSQISIEFAIESLKSTFADNSRHVDARFDKVESMIIDVKQQVNQLQTSANPLPRNVIQARFDYNLKYRNQCDPNTRLEALSTVYHWLIPSDARLSDLPRPLFSLQQAAPVCWIHGVAGTGKSTIAQTVAEWCEEAKFLGASFFCAREGERSNVQLIFTSIAYQLSLLSDAFRTEIIKAMKANPDIHAAVAARQLLKLVVEPLRVVGKELPPCAVIVDALDECNDFEAVSVVLKALSVYITELGPLRFLITSRPVPNIDAGFREKALLANTQQFPLAVIPTAITTRDITLFLHSRFARVKEDFFIAGDWPVNEDVDALVGLANGLFIFAATAVKFVADEDADSPEAQLNALVHSGADRLVPRTNTSPFTHLDKLYLQVLNTAYPNPDSDQSAKARVKAILGSIVLLREELPPGSLDDLFHFPSGTVRRTLRRVHSILTVPPTDQDSIRVIHKSFSDFLVDPSRCSNNHFLVKPRLQQTLIAKACLQTLQALERNICGIEPEEESLINSEIPNLAQRVRDHILPHLQYSCRQWANHLRVAEVDQEIWDLLERFCKQKLLHWLEALSLLGDLDIAIEALQFAREALEAIPFPSADVPILLYDCERVVRSFYPSLSLSCFQAYRCVVPFSPTKTLFRATYSHQAPHTVVLRNGAQQSWSLNTTVSEAHSSWVQSVAYSPDGASIVSGSHDHSIRLWDARTAAQLNVLQGHVGKVFSVAFSLDGKEIMSGSEDHTVKVWDASTGACLDTWEWHTGDVRCVVYSPNGQYAASSSFDHTVVLWKLSSPGVDNVVFTDHWAGVHQVIFTRDSTFLLSAGEDQDCHVWDVARGSRVQTLHHEFIMMSAAVSHDDQLIACGLADGSVVLWRRDGWTRLRVLQRHGTVVWAVGFSPDDKMLASGSWDRTVCLWDVETCEHLETLHEHSDQVLTLDFSPDGLWLVTGSCDTTVRIWEVPQSALRTERRVYALYHFQDKSPEDASFSSSTL